MFTTTTPVPDVPPFLQPRSHSKGSFNASTYDRGVVGRPKIFQPQMEVIGWASGGDSMSSTGMNVSQIWLENTKRIQVFLFFWGGSLLFYDNKKSRLMQFKLLNLFGRLFSL